MEVVSILAGVKEVAVTAAAVTGAIVALLGLSAWKRQLIGNAEYDIARRYLLALYQLRDSVASTRYPMMTSGEVAAAIREKKWDVPPPTVLDNSAYAAAYELRWKHVMEAKRNLLVVGWEAEVVWGHKATELLKPIWRSVAELRSAIQQHIDGREPRDREESERAFLTLFSTGGSGESDQFSHAFDMSVKAVEEFVRPHLRRK